MRKFITHAYISQKKEKKYIQCITFIYNVLSLFTIDKVLSIRYKFDEKLGHKSFVQRI